MTTQRFGYGRVSTQDQNFDAQQDALGRAGVDKVFIEKISGTKASRPELDKLRELVRPGDIIVITRLDRLGRSTKDLLTIASEFEDKAVELEVLEQNINTKTPEGRFFFTMIAAVAEMEKGLNAARTRDGIASARARGRFGGRPPKLSPTQKKQIRKLYNDRELTVEEIAGLFQISSPSVYRALGTS
jgi:DNA invertase Pin-like site-specific DNA recombinase